MKEKLDGRSDKRNLVFGQAREQIKNQIKGKDHIENMLKRIHNSKMQNLRASGSLVSKKKSNFATTDPKDLGF